MPFRPGLLLALTTLLLASLAGCSGDPPAAGSPSVPPTSGSAQGPAAIPPLTADGLPSLAFAGCRQFHTAFPAQASDLQPLLPEGFTVKTDEAGLAQLQVIANACADGPGDSLWVRVPAVPPARYADPEAGHSVAIEAYAAGAAFGWLRASGIALAEECACAATSEVDGVDGPVLLDTFVSDGAEDDYTMRTALAADTGEFPAYRSFVYVARDGEAVARLVETGEASSNRGLGTVALAYTGPGAAPSVFPGEVAHVVQGLAMAWTVEPLDPLAA